ncbi:ArsR/SmtB family transcription factor [Thermomonospora umbrina]|uniref:Helix-turn-helix protein n=1 Tax=Thermomonospora umbrina TaxID=111806 RepID=A0A3D9SYU6_9ACTN|nr:helix-turn-helix domain-containing protein [Thermomonospora umbrina]REE97744.1 helix-turn-helix protein [Thermomonospora umbrina]
MPEPREITDLDALKALAHPRRQAMLRHLELHGPATSSTLARALGLNSGATSYHLRELAQHGFVAEMPERARGRERWWRAVRRDLRFPRRAEQDERTRAVVDEMNRLAFAADLELFAQAQLAADDQGPWADFPYSRGSIQVTPDELRAFFEEFIALLNRYKRPDGEMPEGARTILTRFLAFPPADVEAEAPREADDR